MANSKIIVWFYEDIAKLHENRDSQEKLLKTIQQAKANGHLVVITSRTKNKDEINKQLSLKGLSDLPGEVVGAETSLKDMIKQKRDQKHGAELEIMVVQQTGGVFGTFRQLFSDYTTVSVPSSKSDWETIDKFVLEPTLSDSQIQAACEVLTDAELCSEYYDSNPPYQKELQRMGLFKAKPKDKEKEEESELKPLIVGSDSNPEAQKIEIVPLTKSDPGRASGYQYMVTYGETQFYLSASNIKEMAKFLQSKSEKDQKRSFEGTIPPILVRQPSSLSMSTRSVSGEVSSPSSASSSSSPKMPVSPTSPKSSVPGSPQSDAGSDTGLRKRTPRGDK